MGKITTKSGVSYDVSNVKALIIESLINELNADLYDSMAEHMIDQLPDDISTSEIKMIDFKKVFDKVYSRRLTDLA